MTEQRPEVVQVEQGDREVLGPLWRGVQTVHTDAMKEDWSVAEYRAAMATALGLVAPSADAAMPTWANATKDQRERLTLLADVELHLQAVRIFITSREKMHPCGVDLHDELLAKVSAAINEIGREKTK